MKTSCRILPLLLLLAITQSAFGWGAAGHELVGDVAKRYLTTKVEELLGDHSLTDGQAVWLP